MSPTPYTHLALIAALALASMSNVACSAAPRAQPTAISWNAQTKATIVLPQQPTPAENTAARDLDEYLTKITGGEFTVRAEGTPGISRAIYVGATRFAKRAGIDWPALATEEWRIKTQAGNLILVGGGTRGTLYATYRFLEDNAGVRWWNPWEESVGARRALVLPALDKKGVPAFSYRDIYMLYGNDNGRFGIRSRLNADGDMPIGAEYGGSRSYGPPYHVHTFLKILKPEIYFATHPEWYLGNGKNMPTASNASIDMSNPAMRQEFLKLLRELIRTSHREAKEKGLPAPDVFSVSQEDNTVSFINTPADAALVKANGGAEAAVLLDFVNYLADGIKDEFPDVFIDTLAYYSGEKAPTKIRPRDNVIVRLCDTSSNGLIPITAARNKVFRENVQAWGKITKNLRVWQYNISFRVPSAPLPTLGTYSTNLRFLHKNNVRGIFTEMEYPQITDMRDLKVWVLAKLLENPALDTNVLIRQFTDGYYGAAGADVRAYLAALDRAVQRKTVNGQVPELPFGFPGLEKFTYLTLDFYREANAIYDRAAAKVAGNPTLTARLNRARFSVDDSLLMNTPRLVNQWIREGNTPESFPFDRDKIAARQLQTQYQQIDLQAPEAQRPALKNKAAYDVARWTNGPLYTPLPAKFRDVPFDKLTVYGARSTRNHEDRATVVNDPEAEGKLATRYMIPESEQKTPVAWGIYEYSSRSNLLENYIKPEEIPGPGYHWYKMGDVKLNNDGAYLFFTWSWHVQIDLDNVYDATSPKQEFEVWANLKFEGPAFPHAKAGDKDAIYVERVVLVKK